MTGVVVQVSIGPGGVPNHAIPEGRLTERGIAGDAWRHPAFHGTRRRAILLMTDEAIEELQAQRYAVMPGSLGENITTRGIDRRALRIGQRWRVGDAVIEITEPRPPCYTIAVYGEGILAAMSGEGMSGFYASVIENGIVRPGDAICAI